MNKTFYCVKQTTQSDCGPTCFAMIARFYGRNINLNELINKAELDKDGVNLLGISNTTEQLGFRTLSVELLFSKLIKGMRWCCDSCPWNQ